MINNSFRPTWRSCVLLIAALVGGLAVDLQAAAANAWHIPFNNTDLNGTYMRSPYVEISNDPATPTTITIYSGIFKGNGANQTGGGVHYKSASQLSWSFAAFDVSPGAVVNIGNNQYWRASFSTSSFPANDVIQYYVQVNTDGSNNIQSSYIYAPNGFGDQGGSQTVETNASGALGLVRGSPFTVRNRAAWIFHANNRVVSGNDVQFWAKVGYIGDPNNLSTRWATNGAVYFTTDGSAPSGTRGTPASGTTTQVVTFSYSHPESNNQGSQSIAGTPMWWVASAPNLLGSVPFGGTVRYRIGFWNTQNNEEKFADHNAATNNTTFSFQNGVAGEPVLTVNGVNANYTTSHVFIDETTGGSAPFTINFQPGQANITHAEVFTNLNRRERAELDANGDGTEDGIHPPDGNALVAGDDNHYYKAYTMTPAGSGAYTLSLPANKTGAYRLTARWKVSGDPNWRWYTAFGRRDHAIVVSPTTARDINLYEINVLNIEANGDTFATRSTFEDLYDAPNAPHQGTQNRWNLHYLKNLGSNWLWFQPIHPVTLEAQMGFDPGSPYSVRNFFEINPLMSVGYNPDATSWSGMPINPTVHPDNRNAARLAFKGFVAAADQEGVGVMLDAPFNHTAPDCELTIYGVNYIAPGRGTIDLFRDVEARFYSRSDNYGERASGAHNIAIAPDRGDFGKWGDVRDVFFGNYSSLVARNPEDNGNYNNESDQFDYTSPNWTSDDRGDIPGFQNVTRGVWKYFTEYTLHWLTETGVPAGSDLFTQTTKGIDGLRADFGQGLPPQFWEYCVNKTRTRKWNFVFMAESLDGGAVTYRSNRHFDVLNENIVFPLKAASNASDYRNIFEARRSSYGQSLVLLNNMSHDEESYDDPWQAVVRYAVASTVDGIPLIFPGQELGISRTFGYQHYETNFGKQIAHFKRYNSMLPAWNDANYGNDQLYLVYQGIGQARLFSPALRSPNRYFLNEDGNDLRIFGVAKYQTLNGSPASSDVVFAFANTNRDQSPSGNFRINHDVDNNGVNDYGLKRHRTYGFKNIAAYLGWNSNRRNVYINRKTGAELLDAGLFVSMNGVPTTNEGWGTNPYEGQYLKVYDVTPPSQAPGTPTLERSNQYGYAIENGGVKYCWNAVAPDEEGIQPTYKVTYQYNNQQPGYFFTTNTCNTFQINAGNNLTVYVQAVNPNDLLNAATPTGPSSPAVSYKVISADGDDDGDGVTNAGEDIAGTNPFDATSTFKVVQIVRVDANSVNLMWESVPGKTYRVVGATSPAGTYNPINGSAVTANANVTHVTIPSSGYSFFRVTVDP
jgi:hypothetical protein